MRTIFSFFLLIVGINAIAQKSSLTFFSQDGEKFYVILDGIKQNGTPSANVKVTDLTRPNYKAKIIFEDPALPAIDKMLVTQDYDGNFADLVYNIRRDKKGVLELRISSFNEVSGSTAPTTANTVSYTTTDATVGQPVPSNTTTESINVNVMGLNTGTTTTTSQNGESVDVKMNIGGIEIPGMSVTTTTTTSTTRTTTTNSPSQPSTQTTLSKPTEAPQQITPPPSQTQSCVFAPSSSDFAAGKKSIQSQSFSDSQLKVAKNFVKNNCASVAQIKDLLTLFSFEETKLDFAKYAYDFCVDKKNYYQLSESFSFSSSSDELNEFLETK